MGEAKRRKQLGLMPTVHPFEAELDEGGNVTLTRAPEDPAVRARIEAALRETQPLGAAWASAYRTALVMAGGVTAPLHTAEDVAALPVPTRRRLIGELVLGGGDEPDAPDRLPLREGGTLRLRDQQHASGEGGTWQTFPTDLDPQEALRNLLAHPAARLSGEVRARHLAEQSRDGRITIEPEPDEALLDVLEDLTREWHGETAQGWAETHEEALGEETPEPDADGVPVARRVTFELRDPAPLHTPLNQPFALVEGLELHILPEGAAYTLDGETWHAYGDPDAAPVEDGAGELGDLLSSMFDVQTVPVTVWQDGRVEWEEGAVPAGDAERVRAELVEATGAGDPDAWNEWTRAVLVETFADEAPHLAGLDGWPAVQGVRLDLPADALQDSDDPARYFIESEVTFDGVTWRDLYAEDVPEELERLRPPSN